MFPDGKDNHITTVAKIKRQAESDTSSNFKTILKVLESDGLYEDAFVCYELKKEPEYIKKTYKQCYDELREQGFKCLEEGPKMRVFQSETHLAFVFWDGPNGTGYFYETFPLNKVNTEAEKPSELTPPKNSDLLRIHYMQGWIRPFEKSQLLDEELGASWKETAMQEEKRNRELVVFSIPSDHQLFSDAVIAIEKMLQERFNK